MKIKPLHIELMLHYHVSYGPFPLRAKAPAVLRFTKELERIGLIRKNYKSNSGYISTKKGKRYVEALQGINPEDCL